MESEQEAREAVEQAAKDLWYAKARAGRNAKRQAGGYAAGSPPYGYHAVGRELEINPREWRVVLQILAWYEEGVSMRQIAQRLDAQGVPSKRGGRWHDAKVGGIIRRQMGVRVLVQEPGDEPPLTFYVMPGHPEGPERVAYRQYVQTRLSQGMQPCPRGQVVITLPATKEASRVSAAPTNPTS